VADSSQNDMAGEVQQAYGTPLWQKTALVPLYVVMGALMWAVVAGATYLLLPLGIAIRSNNEGFVGFLGWVVIASPVIIALVCLNFGVRGLGNRDYEGTTIGYGIKLFVVLSLAVAATILVAVNSDLDPIAYHGGTNANIAIIAIGVVLFTLTGRGLFRRIRGDVVIIPGRK